MIQDVLNEVIEKVEYFEVRLRKLAIKLMSVMIFGWMIVGSTVIGLILPAYIAVRVLGFHWVKEAEAGVGKLRESEKEPSVMARPAAYRAVYPVSSNQTAYSRQSARQACMRDGLRVATNTVSEAKSFARMMDEFKHIERLFAH